MIEAPGMHAPQRGNGSIIVVALSVAIFVSMLPLAVAPGVLLMANESGAWPPRL